MIEKLQYLKNNQIDVDAGLGFLGDESMYNEILLDFKNGFINQMNEIKTAYESGDIANYSILVHALKSNCRTLGINTLADMAYEHELKSKANDINYVNANITALFTKANEVLTILTNYFN